MDVDLDENGESRQTIRLSRTAFIRVISTVTYGSGNTVPRSRQRKSYRTQRFDASKRVYPQQD